MLNELYTFAEPVQVVPFSSLKWGKFTLLHTVELSYELSRMLHETRKALIKDWELLSKPIPLPDGKILSITEAELLHGEPRFRATIYVK